MDVYEPNQALDTRKSRLFPEKNNGRIHQPVTREIGSRYKSPTPRRFPSPNATKTVTSQPAPVKKRAVSTGRRQVVQPPSPPSPTTPIHDTSVFTELSARKTTTNKLPESLWPSRMRSLSVAFQSNSFSMPISKKEKPPPQTIYDRTLKLSSKVTHKQTVSSSPAHNKATTPERKRSPLKGKNSIDQSENYKPLDGLHSKLTDQHRCPSRIGSNVFNKSIDFSDESIKRFSSPNLRRISNLVSSKSLEKNSGLLPSSPNTSSGGSQRVSPSRTPSMVSVPSRGFSPMRSSSPSRQLCNSNNTASVLTFIADMKRGKKVANRIEDAHNLRLLYNRQVQWRFINASAEAVMNSQKTTAEKSLINAQRTTSQLQGSVAAKKMKICRLKLQLKLYMALNKQMAYLNQWSSIEKDHRFALNGAIEDLQASTLRLPVTGCATANIQSMKSAFCSAIQVMLTMGSSIKSSLSTFDETNWMVSELANVVAQERALLDQCVSLIDSASSLQVEEYSFRTNLVQLRQGLQRVCMIRQKMTPS